MPSASMCVPCLEQHGDVPKLKRFDEAGEDGETVSTFFTSNPYIEDKILRINNIAPDDIHYEQAVGDDSHLEREGSRLNNQHGYRLSEAFEEDEEDNENEGSDQSSS